VPTTRYSVSLSPLCETSREQNTEKIELPFSFWALAPLFSKFVLRFCKNVFEKVFCEQKGTIAHLCAAGCGAASPTLFLRARTRVVLTCFVFFLF
jgi:hypothetical protein